MFAPSYFPPTYFAPEFWPPGSDVVDQPAKTYGGHPLGLAVRNVEARVLPQDTYQLLVTSRLHPIADAFAPVSKGDFGFIMCGSQEPAVADAICSFNIGTPTCEFGGPEGRGYARTPEFLLEDHECGNISFILGEADAEADLFMLESSQLITNHVLHAWGIKNPTDEELAMIIHTIRRRRR